MRIVHEASCNFVPGVRNARTVKKYESVKTEYRLVGRLWFLPGEMKNR